MFAAGLGTLLLSAVVSTAPFTPDVAAAWPMRAAVRAATTVDNADHVPPLTGRALIRRVAQACGHDQATVARCERQFLAFVDQLRSQAVPAGNARARAAAVHAFMHEAILRGTYKAPASDLAVALDGGPYNCASATALLVALLREFDVAAEPVSVVGHVWCRIDTQHGRMAIETTCKDWFVLARRRENLTPQQRAQQPAVWQEHDRRVAQGRGLEETAFVAIFHYNRGVRMLRQGRFIAWIGANV